MAPVGANAAGYETAAGTLNVLTFNVSGIPVIGDFQGTQRELRGNARMAKIGDLLNRDSGCDIIGTQEDFNHHDALAAAIPDFPFRTQSSGGAPLGDGLGVFSKNPIYNVKHTKWDTSYGILSGATDRLASASATSHPCGSRSAISRPGSVPPASMGSENATRCLGMLPEVRSLPAGRAGASDGGCGDSMTSHYGMETGAIGGGSVSEPGGEPTGPETPFASCGSDAPRWPQSRWPQI